MNKYEQAKKFIEKILDNEDWSRVDIEWSAIDEIKELLNKETPMNPFKHGNCNVFSHKNGSEYCRDCGQKLDWSKNED